MTIRPKSTSFAMDCASDTSEQGGVSMMTISKGQTQPLSRKLKKNSPNLTINVSFLNRNEKIVEFLVN